jgi:hypothetical protein
VANEITELCAYLFAAEYQLLVKIREFDENGYWGGPGLSSCAHWLNFNCGMGMNAARERVRVARALPQLRNISSAFAAGTLSYSKARTMSRIAAPENEHFLLNIARHGTAHHIEHWSEGGETSLDNLVRLCRQHHRLVHEGGFSCERTRSGEIVFRDRRERPLPH